METSTLNELEFQQEPVECDEAMSEGVTSSILAVIGRTPLIPLRRLATGVAARILLKLESLNPGGSIKDLVLGSAESR